MDVALDEEIARLELRISRVWQVFYSLGIVFGLVVYAATGFTLAAWCAGLAALYLLWFSVEAELRRRGYAGRGMVALDVTVESTLPWVFLLITTWSQGPAYALGSWLPPLLYAAIIVASAARLRPWVPIALSVSAALTFPAAYFLIVRPQLAPELLAEPLLGAPMQITRAVSLLAGGALAAIVTVVLRRAITRADIAVRERDLFGKYRLEQRIASGGMGTVFEATYCPEGGFERRVAVKQIHPHLARQQRFVEGFRREAELSARLAHPNIVQVLDFGRIEERYFLAMEYVDGLTLSSLMRRLRIAEIIIQAHLVAHIGREILAGLVYSHTGARDARGELLRVVHRDLSPANVLLSQNGEVKISDFGVARALRDSQVAHSKTVVGQVGYMAPEQARALAIDERSDLFSLGVVLWELLCGRPLFDRGAEGPTLLALVSDEIPAPSSTRAVDPAWDGLLLRALERDPDRRYPTARTMLLDLEALADASAGSLSTRATSELAELVRTALDLPETGHDPAGDSREALSQAPTRVIVRGSAQR